jgi:hypothetical protein
MATAPYVGSNAMQIGKLLGCGAFDETQIAVLSEAFEEALRLSDIKDRAGLEAEAVAHRIITTFEIGERDPKRIARMAAEN